MVTSSRTGMQCGPSHPWATNRSAVGDHHPGQFDSFQIDLSSTLAHCGHRFGRDLGRPHAVDGEKLAAI